MVWHELFQNTGVSEEGQEFENFSKHALFLISSGKPLLDLRRKTFGKIHYWTPGKNSFRHPCTQACKMTPFLWKKMCCISPSGNTVQKHQYGKQSIAGWQTVHGVFCQTTTKSCQIHCQITNKMLEIILTKYCQNSATFFSLNDLLYHWTQY